MQFKIEKISEDSFYVNLLLGLPKLIKRYEKLGMKHHYLKRFPPLSDSVIMEWEQSYGVLLPPDMRQFYMSTNGFLFEWNLNLCDEADVVGRIEINPLQELVQLPHVDNIQFLKDSNSTKPALGADVKIFELVRFGGKYSVVLVFSKYRFTQNIWVRTSESKFYYLTHDFSTYFRMCIGHLGIPCWQLVYTDVVLPQWIQNLVLLLTPTLPFRKQLHEYPQIHLEQQREPKRIDESGGGGKKDKAKLLAAGDMLPLNTLDVGVFTGNFNVLDRKGLASHRKGSRNYNKTTAAKTSKIGVKK